MTKEITLILLLLIMLFSGCLVGNNLPDHKYSWDEITAFADKYWHYCDDVDSEGNTIDFNYWNWLQRNYLRDDSIGPEDYDAIREEVYSNAYFSYHHYLGGGNQIYDYAMIGKYPQFIYGWEDIDDKNEDGEYINPGIRDKNGSINYDLDIHQIKSTLRDTYMEMYFATK